MNKLLLVSSSFKDYKYLECTNVTSSKSSNSAGIQGYPPTGNVTVIQVEMMLCGLTNQSLILVDNQNRKTIKILVCWLKLFIQATWWIPINKKYNSSDWSWLKNYPQLINRPILCTVLFSLTFSQATNLIIQLNDKFNHFFISCICIIQYFIAVLQKWLFTHIVSSLA